MLLKYRSGSYIFIALIFISILVTSHASASSISELNEEISGDSISDTHVKSATGPAVGRVTAINRLNVRSSPGGKIIAGLQPGTVVEILSRNGEWFRIRYGKTTAYAHTSLVAVESGTPQVVELNIPVPAAGTVTAKYRLNVRRSPWGEIIDGYKPGTQVEIVACEGEWYRIRRDEGFAYVHSELVRVNGNIAPDQTAQTIDTPVKPAASTQPETSVQPEAYTQPEPQARPETPAKPVANGGINGPGIPAELMQGLEAAKRSKWLTSHKCLQFAGTIAHEAGAPDGKTTYTQPQSSWPADTALRGSSIDDLPAAVESGRLLPGMLIHVKIHYDRDPAYHISNDAHHWFVYMGKDEQGVSRFADNTHKGNLQTANDVYRNMRGWENSKKYGDSQYGYIPRVTAVHDPFAGER